MVESCSQLIEEVSEFDAKTKEMTAQNAKHRMKDYKKTSMLKGIVVFEEFLQKLEQTWKGKRLEASGKSKIWIIHAIFIFT
jgi:DNA primase small subunit